jgi:ABC-type lipoprotein release transport system permease subunit
MAIPVLVLLFIFGLPIFLVFIVGSMLMGLLGVVLSIGIAALKIGLFVVLPIWLVWALVSKIFCRSRKCDDDTPPSTVDPLSSEPPPEL